VSWLIFRRSLLRYVGARILDGGPMTTNQREEERRAIEITPEMISAGVRVLCRYSDRDDPEIVAVHVFQAMADAIEAGQHHSTKGESNG
jgi:hypothetical protein